MATEEVTAFQASESSNPDAVYLTAGEVDERVRSGNPLDGLLQIYVYNAGQRNPIYQVYLDTTTQQLVYEPPVGTARNAANNYSTIFWFTASPHGEGFIIRNYVTAGNAPRLTPTQRSTYNIRMEVPYPTNAPDPQYTAFSIQGLRSRRLPLLTISVPGQDIYWCPINEDSAVPGEKLVVAKVTIGQFLISPAPRAENIPFPTPTGSG